MSDHIITLIKIRGKLCTNKGSELWKFIEYLLEDEVFTELDRNELTNLCE